MNDDSGTLDLFNDPEPEEDKSPEHQRKKIGEQETEEQEPAQPEEVAEEAGTGAFDDVDEEVHPALPPEEDSPPGKSEEEAEKPRQASPNEETSETDEEPMNDTPTQGNALGSAPEISEDETTTFEKDLARLEEIVGKLEDGGLPLEESLNLFEEGQKLLGRCRGRLEKAQVRVRKLLDSGESLEIDPEQLGRR